MISKLLGFKTLAVVLSLLSSALGANSVIAEDQIGILRLELVGLAGASGNVYFSIYDSKDTWLGKNTVQSVTLDIETNLQGDFVITEVMLPVGEYAISVFYDRNGNGKLDTNFIGIPKEPIAISNNAKMKFGPPKYKEAKFQLELEPLLLQIMLEDI